MTSQFTNLTFAPDTELSTISLGHTFSSTAVVPAGLANTITTGLLQRASCPPKPPATKQITSSHFDRAPGRRSALLVHDDEQVARMLALILGPDRTPLLTAVSVVKAMEILSAVGSEIAVMIANLGPTGQALDLLAARRQAGHRTPVVVLKAAQDRRGWAAAIQAGAVAFVDYPVDPAEMQSVIMRVCP